MQKFNDYIRERMIAEANYLAVLFGWKENVRANKIKYLIEKTFVILKLQVSFFYARDNASNS